jgi:hypothetical protein
VTLFQYGFENFKKVSIDDNETNYKVDTLDLFDTENDLFGDSTPLISMENDTYVILPNTADFENTVSTLNYNDDTTDSDVLATINYTYSGVDVGSCDIIFTKSNIPAFSFSTDDSPSQISEDNSGGEMDNRIITTETVSDDTNVVFVNIKIILIGILAIAAIVILLLFIVSVFKSYSFSPKGQSSKRRRQRKKEQRAAKRQARKNARLQKINTKK